jgi:putative ABC transport system ATP-binding protein
MKLLAELHREGRTIVLVTHDEAVASYAKREILIRDGLIASDRQTGQSAAALRTA